jgi:hypothetical protein
MAAYFAERIVRNVPNPTPSFSNILLILKLIKVFQRIEKKQPLNQAEKGVLSRAKKLISKIIEGARVIEDKGFRNAFPIEECISTYGFALTTMKKLNLYEQAQDSTLFFEDLYDKLDKVESAGETGNELNLLKIFFRALGDSFSGEIYRREYQTPKTLETPFFM